MSGVYIHGMEMPKNCWRCEVGNAEQMDNCPCPFYLIDGEEQEKYAESRHPNCPLTPVPEHGRLGDLDDVINDVRLYLCEGCSDYFGPDAKTESCDYCAVTMLIKTIARKSSIIPRAKGKQEAGHEGR